MQEGEKGRGGGRDREGEIERVGGRNTLTQIAFSIYIG